MPAGPGDGDLDSDLDRKHDMLSRKNRSEPRRYVPEDGRADPVQRNLPRVRAQISLAYLLSPMTVLSYATVV
jgi:hypothetical protein